MTADQQGMLDIALALCERGLPITLNRPGTKKPLGEGWSETSNGTAWQNKQWTPAEIRRAFRKLGLVNPGLKLGPKSGVIDIEGDRETAETDFAALFDGSGAPVTPTFAGRRGRHRLFAWAPKLQGLNRSKIELKGLEILVGANGKAAQTLLPPSTTDGIQRQWLVSLDECDPAELPEPVISRILQAGEALKHREHREHKTSPVFSVSSVFQEVVEAAIARTLPTAAGQRHRRLFEFARHLKAAPQLAEKTGAELRPFVAEWHSRALPIISTKGFSESWLDFQNAWQAVQYPAGQEPIAMRFQEAMSSTLPAAAENYEEPELRQLVAFCRQLQRVSGDKPFFLAGRIAADVLGIPHLRASRWLKLLVLDEVLRLAKEGTRHKASEYFYMAAD